MTTITLLKQMDQLVWIIIMRFVHHLNLMKLEIVVMLVHLLSVMQYQIGGQFLIRMMQIFYHDTKKVLIFSGILFFVLISIYIVKEFNSNHTILKFNYTEEKDIWYIYSYETSNVKQVSFYATYSDGSSTNIENSNPVTSPSNVIFSYLPYSSLAFTPKQEKVDNHTFLIMQGKNEINSNTINVYLKINN